MADAPAGGAPRTVLFEFDRVLVRGDAFELFARDRCARHWFRKVLVWLASPCLLAVRPFSRRRVRRALARIALLGVGEQRYGRLAAAFAGTLVHRPRQFHRAGLNALRRHQAAGDRVVVVTTCEDRLVRAVLAELGLAGIEVVASRLRRGAFGMRPAWHNVGRRKLEALARCGIAGVEVAYCDSGSDLPLLAAAAEPVLVNATPKLCMRIEKALGRSAARVEWR